MHASTNYSFPLSTTAQHVKYGSSHFRSPCGHRHHRHPCLSIMDIAVMPDSFQVLAKHLFHRALSSHHLSLAAAGNLQISALLSAVDAVASPPVRSTSSRTATRTLRKRRRCRTRRRRRSSAGGEEDRLFYGEGGGGDDGPIGGGGGGWNFHGFGGFGWDDSSSSPADPAFDFVYEVVCWLVFSNCLHFAFKRVVRLVAEGFSDHGRDKVPMRMASVC